MPSPTATKSDQRECGNCGGTTLPITVRRQREGVRVRCPLCGYEELEARVR